MRSPGPSFDLSAAIVLNVRTALAVVEAGMERKHAVHRVRVSLKRARALARVGSEAAPGFSEVFQSTARPIMHRLAPTRDLAAVSRAARRASKHTYGKAASELANAAERLEKSHAAVAPIDVSAVIADLQRLMALAQVWPEASPRQIKRGAQQVAKRARKARRLGLASSEPAVRHRWRKREKDRLYAAEALGGMWPGRKQGKRAAALCDALGKERDALILLTALGPTPLVANAEPATEVVLKALRRNCKLYIKRANGLGARMRSD